MNLHELFFTEWERIEVELSEVPEGAIVTKRTGTFPYVVRTVLQLLHPHHSVSYEGKRQSQPQPPRFRRRQQLSERGCRYLVGPNGVIDCLSTNTRVVWLATKQDLLAARLKGEKPLKSLRTLPPLTPAERVEALIQSLPPELQPAVRALDKGLEETIKAIGAKHHG